MIKKSLKLLFSICAFALGASSAMAQDPDGLSCATALPFCSDSSYYFPNFSTADGVTAPIGPNYGCLFSQPNPIWYYMKIDEPGTMQISIEQTSTAGLGIDVDFAMWGPFDDLAEGCELIMSGTLPPLQCSYSALSYETIGIGLPGGAGTGASTPPPAETGQIYVVLLTNFSGQPGNISFEQTAGTATTDCSIINCGLKLFASAEVVCQGETVYLTAVESSTEGDISYQWYGLPGLSATTANTSYTFNTAGDFTLYCMSVVTLGDETDTCIEEISVRVNPTFHFTENVEICQGETYTWQGDLYYTSGNFTKTYKTVNGCDSVYTLNLVLKPRPNVKVNTHTPFICEGDEAVITLENPEPTTSYQWFKDGVAISGATTQSYAATQAGQYQVAAVTDKGCRDTSRVVTIMVNPAAIAQIKPLDFNPYELCIGDTVTFHAEYFPGYLYYWSPEKFFRYISGNRTDEAVAELREPTYVKVIAYNEYGCKAEDSIWVAPVPCCDVALPTAFSPNQDGVNDYFNINLQPGQRVVTFQIFDRWGNMVYDNGNPNLGWDGRDLQGREVHQDVYFYRIVYSCTDKQNYEVKGDITLVR